MVVPEHGASWRKNHCGATAKTALLASRSISRTICFLMNPAAPCHEIGSFDNAGIRSPLIVTLLEFGRSIRVSLMFVDSSSKQTAENSPTLRSSVREVFGLHPDSRHCDEITGFECSGSRSQAAHSKGRTP